MFKRPEKQKEESELQLSCSTCGKPIAGKARTDVTRYLFQESRCQCGRPTLVVDTNGEEEKKLTALPGPQLNKVDTSDNCQQATTEKSKEIPAWQAAVLANLPEQYEVLSMIGEGGMGTVWKVRDKSLDKIFAIKVLRPWLVEDDEALRRFEQEAEAARNLTHVNLASVYGFGMGKQGAPYLVMDYLDGDNLSTVIQKEGCVDVPRAVDLFIQIAEAVGHAHLKGVIHRDIKPTNIIVERNQEGIEIAKLVDFGIAKILPGEGSATKGHTRTGDVFGSPPYMSPEQCLGDKLDAYSDVYALGCVMYETLCGKPPFSGENSIKTILQHLDSEAVPIVQASKQQAVPADLGYIVMRCLEKSPIDRYMSMQELEDDLKKLKAQKPITRARKVPILQPEKKDDLQALYRRQSLTAKWSGIALMLFWGPFIIVISIISILSICSASQYCSQSPLFQDRPSSSPEVPPNMVSTYDYNSLVEKTDGFVEKLEDLANSYIANKQYDKAISLLDIGIQHYRDCKSKTMRLGEVLQNTGFCYKMLGKYQSALPYYAGAMRIYQDRLTDDYISTSEESEAQTARRCMKELKEVLLKLNRPSEAASLSKKWHI
jgi:serine/threonine protein kinase